MTTRLFPPEKLEFEKSYFDTEEWRESISSTVDDLIRELLNNGKATILELDMRPRVIEYSKVEAEVLREIADDISAEELERDVDMAAELDKRLRKKLYDIVDENMRQHVNERAILDAVVEVQEDTLHAKITVKRHLNN